MKGNRMIRLIALDIDDTLVISGKPVSPRNADAIAKAREKGVKIIIATGRGFAGSEPIRKQLQLDEPVINYGGALVSDGITGKPLYTHYFTEEESRACFRAADAFGLHAQIYDGDIVVFREWNAFTEAYTNVMHLPYRIDPDLLQHDLTTTPKILMYTDPSTIGEMLPKVEAMLPDTLHVLTSKPGFLEVGSKTTDKASALKWIADYYGFDRSEVVAIGDNTLDQSMIEWAGIGCCVANGGDSVKAVSDRILPSCADDGVAWFIENEVL